MYIWDTNIKHSKLAFTLVELIIVITILAILASIAFISFQWYTKNSRDSSRLTSLVNIEKWLQAFQINTGNYPIPDNFIQISSSGNLIWYQWYIWDNVTKNINSHGVPKDPFDGSKYLYTTNVNKTTYQTLSFLENPGNNITSMIEQRYADNSTRIPYVKWNRIGILIDNNNNPITSNIDISSYTGSQIKAYLDNTNNGLIIGTWWKLFVLEKTLLAGWVKKNCYEYLQSNNWLLNKDGIYLINPTGNNNFNVYCDMTNDGGWWTFIGMSTWSSNSWTIILSNNQIWDFTDINASQTVKISTSNINSIISSGKNTLRINNSNGKKRIIEYANNWQKLDFEVMKSYNIRITEANYGITSPFFTSHPDFILFTWITADIIPPPTWCSIGYDRFNYGYYVKAQERYFSMCVDGSDGWWTPFMRRSWWWQALQYYNYKLFVK